MSVEENFTACICKSHLMEGQTNRGDQGHRDADDTFGQVDFAVEVGVGNHSNPGEGQNNE